MTLDELMEDQILPSLTSFGMNFKHILIEQLLQWTNDDMEMSYIIMPLAS